MNFRINQNKIGAAIKCAAVRPDLFSVAMLGQTICATAQAFTLSVPARLSALWFGPSEIATATSIGVFANQLGSAIGFLVPPNIVTKSDSIQFMQTRFYYLLIPSAGFSLIVLILAFICNNFKFIITRSSKMNYFLFKIKLLKTNLKRHPVWHN